MKQIERIVAYLKDHGSITTYEAFAQLGITRLSARIFDMQELGYEFEKRMITKKNKYGTVNFTEYRLVKSGVAI